MIFNFVQKFKKVASFLKYLREGYLEDKCKLHASALTFITLLTLIPFLAFLFAISKGLGIQEYIQGVLIEKLALGQQEIFLKILEYIKKTNMKTLGTTGIIFLFLTVLRLLGSIEEVFNTIWKVKTPRRITRKISDYFTIVILCPIFIFFTITITAGLNSNVIALKFLKFSILSGFYSYFIKLLPFITISFALCIFYMFMPNTKVNFSAGLLSGIVAGTIWQVFQWGYLKFQIGITKYNAIYGTFASLPIFMVWLYISWTVILLGAELSFAFQNRKKLHLLHQVHGLSMLELGELFRILKTLTKRFQEGKTPLSQDELLLNLNLEPAKINQILNYLIENKILAQSEGKLYFIKNPSNIKLEEVFFSKKFLKHTDETTKELIKKLFNSEALRNYSLGDLI